MPLLKPIDRQILDIALPAIVSNITVPLLGLVDVTIVGHLGNAAYIGAIAVGGMLFNIIYWIFGFLRMGTSGMTAQATGRNDDAEAVNLLLRSLSVAMGVALLLIVLQGPICRVALRFVQPTPEVGQMAATYFHICIWGAPAMLGLYGLTGWFIGRQDSRIPMLVAIVQNVANITASLLLVYGLGMKVEGVALGTLLAQYAGLLTALVMGWRKHGALRRCFIPGLLWRWAAFGRFFAVNRDIFLRTLCLVAVTLFFTSAGARQGNVVLAVNTLLMQLFTLFSYVMDGFAYAGEAVGGRYIGARDPVRLRLTVRHLFAWGWTLAAAFTLTYALGGQPLLALLTDDAQVVSDAATYLPWALLIPVAGVAAFVWDGLFIGATATRGMLSSMAVAAALFFLLYFGLRGLWGNHALWLAFVVYLSARGLVQTGLWRRVAERACVSGCR